MTQDLTFADLYRQKRSIQLSSFPKLDRDAQRPLIIDTEDIDKIMLTVVQMLEEDPKVTVRDIVSLLKHIPGVYLQYVTNWNDSNFLNILHHSIINNKPHIVEYLLENNYFPKTHNPKLHPYAHLAATIGHKECLRMVLLYRPGDFFKGSLPCHAVKLPEEIMKRLKISDTTRSGLNKNIDRLLDRIKSNTEDAERALQALEDHEAKDVGEILSNELVGLDKHHPKHHRSRKIKAVLSAASSKQFTMTEPTDTKHQTHGKHHPNAKKELKKIKSVEKVDTDVDLDNHMKPRLKPRSGKHLIRVFWNALHSPPPGVVRGAGFPVEVNYTKDAFKPRSSIDLNHTVLMPPDESKVRRNNISFTSRSHATGSKSQTDTALTDIRSKERGSIVSGIPSEVKRSINKKNRRIEVGVRGIKKYKDFTLKIEHRAIEIKDESHKYMNKTPLTLAAERGHLDCVQLILDMIILKNNPMLATKEPLTLATKARCPEAILLLLEKRMTRWDYQSAVLMAIRELFPDCLSALLSSRGKERQTLFDGVNLFHILYSQSLISDYRYEMMPEMTRVLINCREDVNSRTVARTFPMYTLINCAFNITIGKQILFYIDCLDILLGAKANPHYNEEKAEKGQHRSGVLFTRQTFTSAINCILESAKNSVNFFESPYWSKIFMKKFIVTIENGDRTSSRILNDVLFEYMRSVCALGLDRSIIKSLLRYGGNPDFRMDGKYAINVYFDQVLPYLTRFEVINSYNKYQNELDILMIVCRGMTHRYLSEALLIFLDEHLLTTPIQALPVCRYFSYLINERLRSPRPLSELVAQFIWVRLRRNAKRARQLPLRDELISLIIP